MIGHRGAETRRRRFAGPLLRACASLWPILLASCAEPPDGPPIAVVGGPGASAGRFSLPRALARDGEGRMYVVDKSGRIQRFGAGGRFERGWSTPAIEQGRPAGLAWDPRGTLLVADTHYHRILRYTPDGALVGELGGEGREPGRFIYPTGLAAAADGTLYVSEFGGNDRIQAFGPDGRFLRQWGSYGEEPGQFKRPQGIALSGDVLYVADAANHRIQAFGADGRFLRQWDGVQYPYAVAVDGDGHVLVAEYGRHRISRFTSEGRLVGAAGRAGDGPGELNTPWCVLSAGDTVVVADSGNHRLQLWPASMLKGGSP